MVARIIKIILWSILLVPVIVIVAAVVYYQFDAKLRPDVAALVYFAPAQVPEDKNGYYVLLGMFAPANVEPRQKASEIIAEAKKRYAANGSMAVSDVTEVRDAWVLSPRLGRNKICNADKASRCLEEVRKDTAAVKTLLETNQIVLQRYRSAFLYPQFQETEYYFGLAGVMDMNRLAQADIAVKWLAKDYQQALTLLSDESYFWRRAASSDVSLITRMIGMAILQRNLRLTEELLADCSKCVTGQFVKSDIFEPMTPAELSIGKAFRYEAKLMFNALHSGQEMAKDSSRLEKVLYALVYKKNTTINKLVTINQQTIRLSECPLTGYANCFHEYKTAMHRKVEYLSWEFLDDPLGSVMAEVAKPAYDGYVFAAIKYESLRRLVLAKYQIGKKEIKQNDIAAYLQERNQVLGNPVTGKPIEWDAKTGVLRMSFPAEIEQKPIEVAL